MPRSRRAGTQRLRGTSWASHRDGARLILEEWGATTHARIALLPNYDYLVAAGGRAVVPFVISGKTALALGAPSGPPGAVSDAVHEFTAACRGEGLNPVFVPARPEDLGPMLAAGLRAIRIGEEARVPLAGFDLRGGPWKSVRQSLNRSVREGFRFEVFEPPIGVGLLHRLREVSESWLAMRGRQERTFGLGWFEPQYLARFRIAALTAPDGRVAAFANLLDSYRTDEGSVDLTRHHAGAPPGTMDALFARVALWYRDMGKDVFSLGLAPLAGTTRAPNPSLVERALAVVYRVGGVGYSFNGVRNFKNKFRPRWEPRYLCYPSLRALPRALVAAAEVRFPGLPNRRR